MASYFRTTLTQATEIIGAIDGRTDPTDYHFANAEIGDALYTQIAEIQTNNARTEQVIDGLREQGHAISDVWFTLNDVVFSFNAANQVESIWAYNADMLRREIGDTNNPANLDALAPRLDDGARQPDHIGDYIYTTENGRWNEETYRDAFTCALNNAARDIQVEQLINRLDATATNPATGIDPGHGPGEVGPELPGQGVPEEPEDPTVFEPPPEIPGPGEGGGASELGEFR